MIDSPRAAVETSPFGAALAAVMLAASAFSLLLPAFDRTVALPLGTPQAALAVVAALAF